jgi:hypothetical protein
MADPARKRTTGPGELESVRFAEVVEAHHALLRSSEYTRDDAWSRFLEALRLFLSEPTHKDS